MYSYLIFGVVVAVAFFVFGMLFGKRNSGITDKVDTAYKNTVDKAEEKIKKM